MKLKVIIEKGTDGYFTVHCPSLKSCWSQGKTKEEALKNIREAIESFSESKIEDFREDENHKIVNWYYETSSTLWTTSIFNIKQARFYINPQKWQPCQNEAS